MSKVKISRDSGYADRARKYKIFCNAKHVGDIRDGEIVELDISPGNHLVWLRIDWCGSNKLELLAEEGETIHLNCGSGLRGPKLLLTILYITFLRNKYLWLTHVNR